MKRIAACGCAVLVAAVLSFALRSDRAHGGVDEGGVPGTTWVTPGFGIAKIQTEGSVAGCVTCADFVFGPNIGLGLAANEWCFAVDDCFATLRACGTYTLRPNGKPVLDVDLADLEGEVTDLFGDLLGGVIGGLVEITVDSAKATAQAKRLREGGSILKVNFKTSFTACADRCIKTSFAVRSPSPRRIALACDQ